MTKGLCFAVCLAICASLALGCGRLKQGAVSAAPDAAPDDAGGADAAPIVTGCLLGSSPIATSTVCGPHPELCGDVCGAACVDLDTDGDNCGKCGVKCKPTAACNDGVCGAEPGHLVASAPGCRSIRLAHEDGAIIWTDMGHRTLNRIATGGGGVATLVSGLHPAAIFAAGDQPLFINSDPVATGIVVRGGTVFWIEAADDVVLDEAGLPHGGGGVTILSMPTAGGAPKVLLPGMFAPAASPVSSAADGGVSVEMPGTKPPISAIALSPDGLTLYFGAGTRLYKMPSSGAVAAGDVRLVGFTSGPEHGFATALAADDQRLFFPSSVDTWVEIFDLTKTCDAASSAGYMCPSLVFGSHPIPLLDTVVVKDGFLFWAKENNVWRADLAAGDPSLDGHATASDTIATFSVTGFAVGPQHAYFGENVYIEKGSFSPVAAGGPPLARILARGQTWPSSLAIDGTNVYWTTTDCDIAFIADSPQ